MDANSIDFFLSFLSFYFLNIPIVPFNESASLEERNNIISNLCPQLILINDTVEICNSSKALGIDCAIILYTSGSTGNPKGVLISKKSLKYKLEQLSKKIDHNMISNTLCFISTFFGHGLIGNSLLPLFHAKNFYIMKKMSVDSAFELPVIIKKYDINFFSTVPSHLEMFLKLKLDFTALTTLKRVQSASSILRDETAIRILNILPESTKLFDVYGATELLSWYGERAVDKTNLIRGFDFYDQDHFFIEGELMVEGKNFFSGYIVGNQIHLQDVFKSHDLFENGIIVGRTSNVINKSGIKYQIEELEKEYLKFEGVIELVAFGVMDKMYGEKIGVALVLKEGYSQMDFKSYCNDNIPNYRVPQILYCIEKIPKNERGKIDRILLKSMLNI